MSSILSFSSLRGRGAAWVEYLDFNPHGQDGRICQFLAVVDQLLRISALPDAIASAGHFEDALVAWLGDHVGVDAFLEGGKYVWWIGRVNQLFRRRAKGAPVELRVPVSLDELPTDVLLTASWYGARDRSRCTEVVNHYERLVEGRVANLNSRYFWPAFKMHSMISWSESGKQNDCQLPTSFLPTGPVSCMHHFMSDVCMDYMYAGSPHWQASVRLPAMGGLLSVYCLGNS